MTSADPGLVARQGHVVTDADTAVTMGSGDVPVLATPRLVAWMEAATLAAVAAKLGSNQTSVGARVELDHLAPSPVGARITVRAELVGVDERRLTFTVVAEDDSGQQLARGRLTRAVVGRERFLARLNHHA